MIAYMIILVMCILSTAMFTWIMTNSYEVCLKLYPQLASTEYIKFPLFFANNETLLIIITSLIFPAGVLIDIFLLADLLMAFHTVRKEEKNKQTENKIDKRSKEILSHI